MTGLFEPTLFEVSRTADEFIVGLAVSLCGILYRGKFDRVEVVRCLFRSAIDHGGLSSLDDALR